MLVLARNGRRDLEFGGPAPLHSHSSAISARCLNSKPDFNRLKSQEKSALAAVCATFGVSHAPNLTSTG